jgi:hypothetical protein
MVKRRSSPYAAHDRSAPLRVRATADPQALFTPSAPLSKAWVSGRQLWSISNPRGRFAIWANSIEI